MWDCLFYEGTKVLFRVGLTLLKLHETRLLECRDFMDTMAALREMPRSELVLDCHTFMQVSRRHGSVGEGWQNALVGSGRLFVVLTRTVHNINNHAISKGAG